MASAVPPHRRLSQKALKKASRSPSHLAQWWDEFYSKRRIWQLVALVGFIFLVLMVGISWLLRLKVFGEIKGENVASTAMTMTGGLIAISYVVLKYRERISVELSERREEEQAADRKLGEAVTLLSDDKPIIQISGVYALVAVADEFRGAYHQRVVDILCAYIRSNKYSGNAAVEATIMGEIQKRVNEFHNPRSDIPAPNTVWSGCVFDFHGARFFEPVKLINPYLQKRIDFSRADFKEGLRIEDTHMKQGMDCSDAVFGKKVEIKSLIFQEMNVNFTYTQFKEGFSAEHFSYAGSDEQQKIFFYGARFNMWEVEEIPFSYSSGAPIESVRISLHAKDPASYESNNTTVSEMSKSIPKHSAIIWRDEEVLSDEDGSIRWWTN